MASPAVIGDLVVKIGADVSGLAKGAAEAESTMGRLGKGINAAMKVAISTAVAAAAALALLTQQSWAQIDADAKLAARTHATVAAIQSVNWAAKQAGASNEEMKASVESLDKRLGQAIRDGMSPASDALKRLGLDAKQLSKMDADDRLALIADRIKKLGLNSQQTADLMAMLGIKSSEIANMMRKGGDEIRNARADLEAFGVTVNQIDAKQIEQANDAFDKIGLVIQGVGNKIAVAVAPAVQAVSEYLTDAAKKGKGWGETIEWAVGRAVVSFGIVKSVIHGVRIIWDETVGGILDGVNWIIRAWNKIAETIPGLSKTAVAEISHDYGNLRDEIGEPPSQAEWEAWWEGQKKKARDAASVAVDAQKDLGNAPRGGEVLSSQERKQLEEKFARLQEAIANEDQALKLQRDRQLRDLEEFHKKGVISTQKYNEAKLQIADTHQLKMNALIQARLEEGILTEQELLTRKHALQLEEIRKFEENKTITAQRANELRLLHMREYSLKMAQVTAQQYSQLASIVDTSMGHISGIIRDENSKAFKIMKVISTATALVKGYEAMVSAYAAGSRIGGPGLGAAFAAVAAAGTGAIIAKIHGVGQNTTGGSLSAPVPSAAPAAAPQSSTLMVRGIDPNSLFSGTQVREIASSLLDFQKNGGEVVFKET